MTLEPNNPPESPRLDPAETGSELSTAIRSRQPRLVDREGFLNLLLVFTVVIMIAHTLLNDAVALRTFGNSQATDEIFAALEATKVAYRPDLATTVGTSARTRGTQSLLLDLQGREAIKEWLKLATARTGRAAEWRRLGITQALFHQPGALDALRHVADRFPPPTVKSSVHPVDPFGHLPVPVPPAQEIAGWQAIYGPQRLLTAQVPALRRMLAQLRLGWFENVAAAQLYAKAGIRAEAERAAQAADRSATGCQILAITQIAILILGVIGLCLLGIFLAVTSSQQQPPIRPSYSRASGVIEATTPTSGFPQNDTDRSGIAAANVTRDSRTRLFPYIVLIQAFLVYLLGQELIGFFASLGLYPLQHRLESLSGLALLRLELWLQLLLYIPVLGLPLLTLRNKITFDPLTGERMTLRALLAAIGFRTTNPLIDIGAGVLGYLLVMPVVAIASVISSGLFAHVHTPNNPAELWMLAAQSNGDRLLVLFLASAAAPFAEETMFRGILYPALRQKLGVWGGAVLSGAIFSGIHPTLPGGFLPIWVVGIGLALVYERRKSLLPGMVLHGLFNGLTTLQIFFIFSR